MSQDVAVTKNTKQCSDLNLHKLLAFASLPVSPVLDINEKQNSFESPLSSLISQSHAPPLSQPRTPSSAVAVTSSSESPEHVTETSHSSIIHDDSSALLTPVRASFQDPANSNIAPQMIAPKDVYKMTPTPVFMTPSTSVYPHVTLIPETDLLRSMIVQDVKQVTQKLFDKNSKKKRGRRREKEEIIPGDFGTLKINFTKFVDVKHPPFSLDDPPVPKRTVYQRIAPYPVVTTDSSKAPEKPSKKTKGSSTRTFKRHENAQIETTACDVIHDSTTCSSSRLKRNSIRTRRNRQRETKRSLDMPVSFEVPASSMSQVNGLGHNGAGHLITELRSFNDMPSDDRSTYGSCSTSTSNVSSAAAVTCIDTNVAESATESRLEFQQSETSKQDDASLVKNAARLDTDSDCIETSPSFLLANSDASYSELLDSSTAMDSSEPNLGSPGVIGSELSSLLSELCNDFPPLTLASAEENMDVAVAGNEAPKQSTATVSVLSQPVTSYRPENCAAGRIDSFAEKTDIGSDAIGEEYGPSLTTSLPSSSFILETISSMDQAFPSTTTSSTQNVSCTTEVLLDSAWEDHRHQSQTLKTLSSPSRDKCPDQLLPASDNLFTMDVDANHSENQKQLLDIVDISPEYASTEGGGKIILIGSWNSKNSRYSCKFGEVCTPCDLIQNGVLRCFCPPHSPGKVSVCVLCDNVIISTSVEFEYVDTEDIDEEIQEGFHGWLNIKDDDLKSLLVERIEAMLDIFDVSNTLPRFQGMIYNSIDIEDTLVNICESMSKVQDRLPINIDYKSENVMTVLHLSASLGFTKLIQTLCNWVETTSNRIIQEEADPCKYDQFHLTPLMWACAKGKFDSVCVLIQWDESSINLSDKCGCTPLSLSKDQGHTILVRYLEKSQSKGSMSKNSSFASDTGSPNLRSGHLSRSSSLNSQVEWGRELHGGNDDLVFTETARKSPGSARVSNDDGSPDSSNSYLVLSRTLGQTLVHVQAIIQDGADTHNDGQRTPLTSIDLDDDSLFAPSPFTPRIHNSSDDRLGNHTPKSLASLSPASPAGSQSPFDPTSKDTAEFCEFFYNSDRILERDFAELTLTDEEQQNLYKAASVIQNAYKRYRERRKQRDVELSAAVLIQSYYRRYKEYAMYKKMQKGALVIQHKYRAHREKKKQKSQAASVIQTYYRRYKERQNQPVVKDLVKTSAPVQQSHCVNVSSEQLNRPSLLPEWKKNKFMSQQRSFECCQEKRLPSTNSIDIP